jgi:alkanesulfonate monooxygenase SsuD/methylene tetrahydromethanopterin reductase-like flavin-dependent oxidoreductase (luciferase family)
MRGTLGMQLTPWSSAPELVAVGESLRDVVDVVWLQDQMLARNVYVVLAGLAAAGCGVGTNVTYAAGRNPIEMASAAATISEMVAPGREMVVGFGTGGALVNSLFTKQRPVGMAREAITLMRALWSGEPVELDAYPILGGALGYRPGAVAKLTYPVEDPPDIVLAGVGPKIQKVAATVADGTISASNFPSVSLAAFRTGRFEELCGLDAMRAARPADMAPLRLIYGINMSVSADREAARARARKQAALTAGNPALWDDLRAVGLDIECAEEVKAALDAGLGLDGAADRVSAEFADALVISGTPEECIGPLLELRRLAAEQGYEEFYMGAPLGPDPLEAAELLRTHVIPEVWPDRAVSRA